MFRREVTWFLISWIDRTWGTWRKWASKGEEEPYRLLRCLKLLKSDRKVLYQPCSRLATGLYKTHKINSHVRCFESIISEVYEAPSRMSLEISIEHDDENAGHLECAFYDSSQYGVSFDLQGLQPNDIGQYTQERLPVACWGWNWLRDSWIRKQTGRPLEKKV